MKTVSVLVDSGNLFHCIDVKWPGRRLNYKKLLNQAQSLIDGVPELELQVARVYGTYVNPGVFDFEQSLRRIGWETKFVPPRSHGQPFDWAVEIALEIWESESDIIVLASSGHEYLPLFERLRDLNDVETEIIACGINNKMRLASHRALEIHEGFLTDDIRSNRSNSEITSA